jgi:cytochrome c biogenesis protein CcmG/thiol:disulfide interchange protein DsbE
VEAPALAKVYREFQGQPVEFLGVDIWDNIGDAEVFLQQEGQAYPNGFDASGVVAIDYGVRGIPEKYFIDREGILVKKLSGPLTETTLRNTINELLER